MSIIINDNEIIEFFNNNKDFDVEKMLLSVIEMIKENKLSCDDFDKNILKSAEIYKKILKRNTNYKKNNPEIVKNIQSRYKEKFNNDVERKNLLSEKKKEYYINVVKPRRLLMKVQMEENIV